jgi:hypothetical protein
MTTNGAKLNIQYAMLNGESKPAARNPWAKQNVVSLNGSEVH